MNLELVVDGERYPLRGERLVVGRAAECDIVLDAEGVSRRHCEVVRGPASVFVRDLGSRNGTFVNGTRISGERRLRPGDRIRVGVREIEVAAPEGEPATPLSSPAVALLLDTVLRAAEIEDPDEFLAISLANLVEMAGAERGIHFHWENLEWRPGRAVDAAGRDLPAPGAYSTSVLDRVRREGRAVFVLEAGAGEATPSMERLQLRSVMVAPLRAGERLLGAFYLDSRAAMRTFGREDLVLFEAAVAHVAMAWAKVRAALERRVEAEAERRRLEEENTRLRAALERRRHVPGRSDAMRRVYDLVARAAPTDAPVLITGETGTGKEAVARALHEMSARAGGPFVVVDCASIPQTLLEAELFGYERGAFTGATAAKPGRIEVAAAGTLFLDEIGDMQPALQAGLLRAIQEREVVRVGATQPRAVDFRVVAATHRDLEEEVRRGRFREDLYYRLAVVRIRVPPLRERAEDIEVLAEHFLAEAARAWGRPAQRLAEDAREALRRHPWPGNVRELKHRIEQAVILCDGPQIGAADLGLPEGAAEAHAAAPLAEAIEAFERRYIARALEEHGHNVTHTAKALGISRQHLQNLMKKHHLRTAH